MNIIRIDNAKSTLSTTYSLTVNVEKHKDINKILTVVILSEEDIENENSLIKLKGINIDVLVLPKKHKFSFNETKYYEHLISQFSKDYNVTYY